MNNPYMSWAGVQSIDVGSKKILDNDTNQPCATRELIITFMDGEIQKINFTGTLDGLDVTFADDDQRQVA